MPSYFIDGIYQIIYLYIFPIYLPPVPRCTCIQVGAGPTSWGEARPQYTCRSWLLQEVLLGLRPHPTPCPSIIHLHALGEARSSSGSKHSRSFLCKITDKGLRLVITMKASIFKLQRLWKQVRERRTQIPRILIRLMGRIIDIMTSNRLGLTVIVCR